MSSMFKRATFALFFLCLLACTVAAQMGEEKEGEEKNPNEEKFGKLMESPWKVDDLKKTFKKGLKATYKATSQESATLTIESKMMAEIVELTATGIKTKITTIVEKVNGKDPEAKDGQTNTFEMEEEFEKLWSKRDIREKNTKVSDEKVKVGDKEYDCKLYTQTFGGTDGADKMTFKTWFIKDKPGIMAKQEYTSEGKDESGKELKLTSVYVLDELKE